MFGVSSLPRTLDAARRDAHHPRRHVRLSVVKDLGRLLQGAPNDAEQTQIEALTLLAELARRDAEPLVRGAATLALADNPSERALDALLLAAKDEHLYVVEMALVGLREVAPMGHVDASRVITKRFRDERAVLRFQAVLAAGRVLDDDTFLALAMTAAEDQDPKVRYVLWRVCDERFAAEIPTRLVSALEAALDEPDLYTPVAAAIVLGPRGNNKARTVLSRAINGRLRLPAPEDEQTLIELIGELAITEGMPGLRAHARGRFGLVPGKFAWQAQIALARLGDAWAIDQLTRGLNHRNPDVRAHSATAVGAARLAHLRPLLVQLGEAHRIPPELVASVLLELHEAEATS
jgi:HEAT repeat protein